MLVTILATIVVLGILVLVHELGHFIAAKLVGVRVERFSIGFWPRLAGIQIGETDYCISWIPLGGYVKMSGMIDESMDGEPLKGEPWEFTSKTTPQKLFVITAGVTMNVVLAVVIFFFLTWTGGIGEVDQSTVVSRVVEDFPAKAAGIITGDEIIALDGNPISVWDEMTEYIHARPDVEIDVMWRRGEDTLSAVILTRGEKVPVEGDVRLLGMIGISPIVTVRDAGFLESVRAGFVSTYFWGRLTYTAIRMLVTGEESLKSIGGPIFIAQLAGDSARLGMDSLFNLIGILSINLAFLNILPIPAFDGGHFVIIVIEWLKRKPLSVRTKMAVQQVGLMLFIALAVLVIYNDIMR